MVRKSLLVAGGFGWLLGLVLTPLWAAQAPPTNWFFQGGAEKPLAKVEPLLETTAAKKPPSEKPPSEKTTKPKSVLQQLWRKIYTRPEELAKLAGPTICILDIQHPDRIYELLNRTSDPMDRFYACRFRARVAAISGLPTIVVHATEVRPEQLESSPIKALLIGGRSKALPRKIDEQFYPFIRQTKIPLLGICGGAQLIARAYGAKVVHMRKLRPGEPDPHPKYYPGWFKEWGLTPVHIVKLDPLFANLPETPIFREFHAFQIQKPPEEFELLASTQECQVQAMKHRHRLVYAVQFHPERYDSKHFHGRIVLENFFRLALGQPLPKQASESKGNGLPKK